MPAASIVARPPLETTDSAPSAVPPRRVRRRIDQQAGRALEILGHAIDYLTDEYVHEFAQPGGAALSAGDGRVKAIQLLMAANRAIYFACPEVEDLATRCFSLLRGRRHKRAQPAGALDP